MLTTYRRPIAALALAALTSAPSLAQPASAAGVPESSESIELALNEWTSQHLVTKIAGRILERMGYNVEYVSAGYTAQLAGIADGKPDASLEIWTVNVGEGFDKLVADGEIEVVGELGLEGAGGWVYPANAEEACPGLPDYQALNACKQLFATPDTMPNGRLVDFPAEWGNMNTGDRLSALGIEFTPISGGSEGAMIAELRSAAESGKPALVYFWWPHWIFADLDLKVVEVPAYGDGCYDDPSWGVNPEAAYDCGEEGLPIVKIAWPGLKDTWPGAHRLLRLLQIDNDEDMQMMFDVEQGGRSEDEVADEWIASNEAKWKGWIAEAM